MNRVQKNVIQAETSFLFNDLSIRKCEEYSSIHSMAYLTKEKVVLAIFFCKLWFELQVHLVNIAALHDFFLVSCPSIILYMSDPEKKKFAFFLLRDRAL